MRPLSLRLYAGAARISAPLLRLWLRRRAMRGKELAPRLAERYGIDPTPRPAGPLLWLHAASVGEMLSVLPVIAALDGTVLLTTGTVTSAALLERRSPSMPPGARLLHRFAPLDVPGWTARFLDHWRPNAAAFVESELWPNLLLACRQRRIPVGLVNARLSPRSARRWERLPRAAADLLGGLAWVQARSEPDAARLRRLGAGTVMAPGDLKWAAPPLPVDTAALAALRTMLAARPLWLAASTHAGEESQAAAVHHRLAVRFPGLLTVIVPRHPDRGAALAAALGAARRADGPPAQSGVWVIDTLNELGLFYRLCPVVFVGKSLLNPGGGQNVIEPARLGCAVAVGPHTGNFTDAVSLLRREGALSVVADAAELGDWVAHMLASPESRAAMADAGRAAASRLSGLPSATAARLRALRDAAA